MAREFDVGRQRISKTDKALKENSRNNSWPTPYFWSVKLQPLARSSNEICENQRTESGKIPSAFRAILGCRQFWLKCFTLPKGSSWPSGIKSNW